jgi:hypothetical protein
MGSDKSGRHREIWGGVGIGQGWRGREKAGWGVKVMVDIQWMDCGI